MSTYGYVRVSSQDQNEDRQMIAMREFGVQNRMIYLDKQSGKDFNRPRYQEMVSKFRAGDLLCIKSIDRLGRNYREVQEEWRILTKEKGIDIVVLDMPILDTRQNKDVLDIYLADSVLNLLSLISQMERDNIHQRQAEGIAAARARGVKFGRPARSLPEDFDRYAQLVREGKMSLRGAARACGMAPSSFSYSLNKKTACSESVHSRSDPAE